MLSSKYFNIYNNNFFLEPLEQFEVTKVGYEFWYNNGFFYSLVQFFKNLNNNDTADINAGSEVYLDNSSIILLSSKNFLLPSFNFENINISYDFFDSYI